MQFEQVILETKKQERKKNWKDHFNHTWEKGRTNTDSEKGWAQEMEEKCLVEGEQEGAEFYLHKQFLVFSKKSLILIKDSKVDFIIFQSWNLRIFWIF